MENALKQWLQQAPLTCPLSHQRDEVLQREIQALLRQRYAANPATWHAMPLYRAARRLRHTARTLNQACDDARIQLNPPER